MEMLSQSLLSAVWSVESQVCCVDCMCLLFASSVENDAEAAADSGLCMRSALQPTECEKARNGN
jgi:hypothetical protein